jgi:hypothetical protein
MNIHFRSRVQVQAHVGYDVVFRVHLAYRLHLAVSRGFPLYYFFSESYRDITVRIAHFLPFKT